MVQVYEEIIKPLDVVHIDSRGKLTEFTDVTTFLIDERRGGGYGVLPMPDGRVHVATANADGRIHGLTVAPDTNLTICLLGGGTLSLFNGTEEDEES